MSTRKLTDDQVRQIRRREAKYQEYLELADIYSRKKSQELFGLSQSTLRDVIDYVSYKEVRDKDDDL